MAKMLIWVKISYLQKRAPDILVGKLANGFTQDRLNFSNVEIRFALFCCAQQFLPNSEEQLIGQFL
jgi:hypothetical protein